MKRLLLLVTLVLGVSCFGKGEPGGDRVMYPRPGVVRDLGLETLANSSRTYDPSVWRFRVGSGWIYVVAAAGDSTTVFIPDATTPSKDVP